MQVFLISSVTQYLFLNIITYLTQLLVSEANLNTLQRRLANLFAYTGNP